MRSENCPNCGTVMKNRGFSGDVRTRRGIEGLDISEYHCPACATIIDDMGNIHRHE